MTLIPSLCRIFIYEHSDINDSMFVNRSCLCSKYIQVTAHNNVFIFSVIQTGTLLIDGDAFEITPSLTSLETAAERLQLRNLDDDLHEHTLHVLTPVTLPRQDEPSRMASLQLTLSTKLV